MHINVDTWSVAAIGAFAYLTGGIPLGWLLVRLTHPSVDVRRLGSGNVGTSNIYRNVDHGLAVFVGPGQFLQGLLPVLLARWLGFPTAVLALVAVCAVIGNGWPVYLGFNGGRGIAVATGAVAGLSLIGLGTLLFFYAAGAIARQIALGVLGGFLVLPIVGVLLIGQDHALGFVGLLILILLRRLEGVRADVGRYGRSWRMLALRLARDERPGRPLVGRRTDA